jgi:hypothetical protein
LATEPEEPFLTARELVGLLAEPERRAVVAALVLGATTVDEVRDATGLDARAAGAALARLEQAGLVEHTGKATYHLLAEAFAVAARASAPESDEGEEAGVPFFRNGRLTQIPARRSKRLLVLDRLAQDFEPGRHYSERMVNLMLGKYHPDTAALRRYLVDEGFLERERGEYWRAGGSFDV